MPRVCSRGNDCSHCEDFRFSFTSILSNVAVDFVVRSEFVAWSTEYRKPCFHIPTRVIRDTDRVRLIPLDTTKHAIEKDCAPYPSLKAQ